MASLFLLGIGVNVKAKFFNIEEGSVKGRTESIEDTTSRPLKNASANVRTFVRNVKSGRKRRIKNGKRKRSQNKVDNWSPLIAKGTSPSKDQKLSKFFKKAKESKFLSCDLHVYSRRRWKKKKRRQASSAFAHTATTREIVAHFTEGGRIIKSPHNLWRHNLTKILSGMNF